jgi:4-amino-4-deoxy-L-arabinose transferase-like glycosyltransferase
MTRASWASAAYSQLADAARRSPRLALALYALVLAVPGLASIPPVDRDEAIFAQSSKQMLESRDFVDIRFQDEPHYRKPVLTYWLQSASASAFGGPERNRIWAYRLPSLLATVLAVLVLFEIARVFLAADGSRLAAVLLAGSLLVQTQAHQARADALLLLSVVACMWPLARAYRPVGCETASARTAGQLPVGLVVLFWISLAAGMLIKGPVALAVVASCAASLALADRRFRWLARLRPGIGVFIFAAALLPWPVTMLVEHGPAFFAQSVGGDLLAKIAASQESHGGPPLYHLVLLPICFWPATFLLPAALGFAWQRRRETAARFCLAWLVPAWLMFELVPTKLPHYVLPLLPALALLAAAGMRDAKLVTAAGIGRLAVIAFALVGAALAGGAAMAVFRLGRGLDVPTIATAAVLLCAVGITSIHAWRHACVQPAALGACAIFSSVLVYGIAGERLERIWVAARVAEAVKAVTPLDRCPATVVGYSEPSLVFLLGTRTRLVASATEAESLDFAQGGAVVVRDDLESAFLKLSRVRSLRPVRRALVEGIDPVHGRPIALSVWTTACSGKALMAQISHEP